MNEANLPDIKREEDLDECEGGQLKREEVDMDMNYNITFNLLLDVIKLNNQMLEKLKQALDKLTYFQKNTFGK